MPLLDHFNPPLSTARHWESFLACWSTTLADVLNGPLLPRDYFAEIHVHVGSRVEVDIATFEDASSGRGARTREAEEGGIATAPDPHLVAASPGDGHAGDFPGQH